MKDHSYGTVITLLCKTFVFLRKVRESYSTDFVSIMFSLSSRDALFVTKSNTTFSVESKMEGKRNHENKVRNLSINEIKNESRCG
jgi:hypothetical protein